MKRNDGQLSSLKSMKDSKDSQVNNKVFMKLAAKHSLKLPKGYKFNREEIYAERFGNTLHDHGKKNTPR